MRSRGPSNEEVSDVPSTERERERLDASFEELDFELPVNDRRRCRIS